MPDEELQTTTSARPPADTIEDLAARLQSLTQSDPEAQTLVRRFATLFVVDAGGIETLGTTSTDAEATVDRIVDALGEPGKTFEQVIRDQIEDLAAGRAGALPDPTQIHVHIRADPVSMFNGQYNHQSEDIHIRGAGLDFVFQRTYKNQVVYQGPLGANWSHSYNLFLRETENAVTLTNGDLTEETYTRHPRFGQAGFTYFVPPDGVHSVIVPTASSFTRRTSNGMRQTFERDALDSGIHRLVLVEDRHGNALRLTYAEGLLDQVEVNHPDRVVRFGHDPLGRIVEIRDHTGRSWRYEYDDLGDLVAFTTPATGRYPSGLRTQYEYSTPSTSGLAQHNLIRIFDPAGQLYLENDYGDASGTVSFNRVVRQRQGSGESFFDYEIIDQVFEHEYTEQQRPAFQTTLTDRNGQVVHFVYNTFGNLLLKEEYVLRHGRRRLLRTHNRFNRDGALTGSLSPGGVLTQYLYGRDQFRRAHGITDDQVAGHEALSIQERRAFGNLLAVLRRGVPVSFTDLDLSMGFWGEVFPDVLGTPDPRDMVSKFTYEPDYGQPLTISDPRFTERADPGQVEQPPFSQSLTRYEYTGPADDPNRLLAAIHHPEPILPDGTPAGPVTERFAEYDPRGRIRKYVDAVGVLTQFEYFGAADGLLEGHLRQRTADKGGLEIKTRYDCDSLGRITAVHHPRATGDGRFITRYAFDELDQVVRITGSHPFGFVTRRYYDPNGKLEREERDAKDDNGVDIPGAPEVRTFRYDEQCNLRRSTLGGRDLDQHLVTSYRYDPSDKRVLTILPRGNRLRSRYDERSLEVAITAGAGSPDASTKRMEHDDDGRRSRSFNARGDPTTTRYDVFGRVLEQVDPLGTVIRRDYDKAGNLIVERVFERTADGSHLLLARSEFDYDVLSRTIRRKRNRFDVPLPATNLDTDFLASPGPGRLLVAQVFFDAKGRVVREIDPLGRETRYGYDTMDRLSIRTDAIGNRIQLGYDAHGNNIRRDYQEPVRDPSTGQVIGQRFFAEAGEYDELDRLVSHANSLGNTSRYRYDSRNNQIRRIDPLGNVRRHEYDVFGRRSLTVDELTDTGLGGGRLVAVLTTHPVFDPNNNLVSLTDAAGRSTTQSFDSMDRRRSIEYPDFRRMDYDYDPDGNITETRDPNGLVRRYQIDPLGRTTRVVADAGGVPPEFPVEGATFERYEYDALNRTRVEENDFVRAEVEFNSLGWPFLERRTFTTPLSPVTGTLELRREFSDAGALTALTYPGGRRLEYGRDEIDRLRRIDNVALGNGYPGSPSTPQRHQIVAFDHSGRQRSRRSLGNGAGTTWRYDGAGRMVQIVHEAVQGPELTIQQLFDAAGNIRVLNDFIPAATRGSGFRYDSTYRLTRSEDVPNPVQFDAGALAPAPSRLPDPIPNSQATIDAEIGDLAQIPGDFTFQYDNIGNRQEESSGASSSIRYTANNLDQYLTVGARRLRYDHNGNLIGDGVRAYRYDSMNRLVRVLNADGTDLARILHDAQGRRAVEISPMGSRALVHNQLNVIAEYQSNLPAAQFVHDDAVDSPIQMAAESAEHWFHVDFIGSVRALTDRTGQAAASYRYDVFGRPLEATGPFNPFRFASRRLDASIGSYDFRTRQYDPALGRFLQRDPRGMVDGSNLYVYAGNNPLTFVDPTGTERRQATHSRPQTSTTEDLAADIVSLAGDSPAGQTLLGAVGAGVSGIAEPVYWLIDVSQLGYHAVFDAQNFDLNNHKFASRLGRSYIAAEAQGGSLDEQADRNIASISLNAATLGLAAVPQAIKQLFSADATPAERGAAAFQIITTVAGLKSGLRGTTTAPGTTATLTEESSALNLEHVVRGGAGQRGIALLHVRWAELSAAERESVISAAQQMDIHTGMIGGMTRQGVTTAMRQAAQLEQNLARTWLKLDETQAASHLPDMVAGGDPVGIIMGLPKRVNASWGAQLRRYAKGFTIEGFTLVDRGAGEILYPSIGLETAPAGPIKWWRGP